MISRRYPQLQTHAPSGRLLAQPRWLAPKLYRSGEVLDVYGAPRNSSQHHPLLQSRRLYTASARVRTNPVRSARCPIGVSSPRRSVANRSGIVRRTAARSSRNTSSRFVSRSNPQRLSRASQRRSENRQGHRAGLYANTLASSLATPETSVPGILPCISNHFSANHFRANQPHHPDAPSVIQVSKPNAPSPISQGKGSFQHQVSGTADRLALSVIERCHSVSRGSIKTGNAGIGNQVLNNAPVGVIPCSKPQAEAKVQEETYAIEQQVQSVPLAVSTPLCGPSPGSEPGASPVAMTETMNTTTTMLTQGLNYQEPTISQLLERTDASAAVPALGIPAPLPTVLPGINSGSVPGANERTMNHPSTLLTQYSSAHAMSPICSPGLDSSEGRTNRSPCVFTPVGNILPACQYRANPDARSQPFLCTPSCEPARSPPEFVALPQTRNTESLPPGTSFVEPETIPLQGNDFPAMMHRVDLAQQMNISPSTRLFHGSSVQTPYQVCRTHVEYDQGGAVTPVVQVSRGVSNVVGPRVGVLFHQACSGFEGQTNNTELSPVVAMEGLEANILYTSNSSSPFSEINEGNIDLPILPDMEELVQEDEGTPECADTTALMETQRDVDVFERDRQRECEILGDLEAMLQGGTTAVPFDEESLKILNSFTSPMETTEAENVVNSRQCGVEGVQEPSVKDQISRIIGLDRELMSKPDGDGTQTLENVVIQGPDPNRRVRWSPVISERMERPSDKEVIDGVVTSPVDCSIRDSDVTLPVDGEVVARVTVADGAILGDTQTSNHGVSNTFKRYPKSLANSFTRSDYGRLQRAVRFKEPLERRS